MATRQHKKRALGAKKGGKNARPHAKRASGPAVLISKITKTPKRRLSHSFGNPFAIPWPSSALPPKTAQRIVALGRIQHRLWSWTVVLALVLLVIVSFFELAPLFGWWPPPTAARERLLEQADLTALLVLVLEMIAQYRAARNKALFVRHNWFLILALLPFGVLLRASSLLEGARAVRAVQVWGKMDELRLVLPSMDVPLFTPLIVWGENAAHLFTQWTGWNEFVELLANISRRMFR